MIQWTNSYGGRLALALVFLIGLSMPAGADQGSGKDGSRSKLDKILQVRSKQPGTSQVIVIAKRGADAPREVKRLGGTVGRELRLIDGFVARMPNRALQHLAERSEVTGVHLDRPTSGTLNRVAVTVGARAAQAQLGYRGAGIGVAVIDSGITQWHDDLMKVSSLLSDPSQRVAAFVDYVNGRTTPYDDNGHGTHVSGIIAGNGFDTLSVRAGIAPAAHIVSLKVLDANGRGVISNVIAALEYAIRYRTTYNIRVVNLSVGARVTESYWTDPLTLAAKKANDAGIVVVAAAGNLGRNANGQTQYGAILAPANAPWVVTVGASDHNGTVTRGDDTVAPFSSRGPSAIDFAAKPDLVAPGVGIVSLSNPASTLYSAQSGSLLNGLLYKGYKPYLSLSGTSMSAPVVAGTVALMLEANPQLTPNLVKALLQYTAERRSEYDPLTQGAGFLNAYGAVRLARFFATAQPGTIYPSDAAWSKQLIWGNHRLTGGVVNPSANAWNTGVVWGASKYCAAGASDCENIVWGTLCGDSDPSCENIVWGTFLDENIVWGTFLDENIVWGTAFNIVWGTFCDGLDCENIVWGTFLDENIVWGTFFDENIVWGTFFDENIVWGTFLDENIVWGTNDIASPLYDDPEAGPSSFDELTFEQLFGTGTTATSSTTAPESEGSTTSESTSVTDDTVTGIVGGTL